MSPGPSSIESDLLRLRATALDESLLARLDACMLDTWTHPLPAELQFEQRLRTITPAELPPALLASLEATVRDIAFPTDENILRFPHQEPCASPHHRHWWTAAAAAMALIGAVTAMLVPARHGPVKLATATQHTRVTSPAPAAADLIPAGFNRGLAEARDEGVIWQPNDRPHRVLKVVYRDCVTLKDAAGHTYQVERPRVEYILVPAEND